jgi:tripartite-type tricarboxylate transporter receptor subunit TctC
MHMTTSRTAASRRVAALASGLLLLGGLPAPAQPLADFYRGKTITMIVGPAPGGNYDMAARLVGRFLVKYLPGQPTLVVQNMPGAGGIAAINHMYNLAPKDGTAIAVMQRAMPQIAYLGDPAIRFDPNRFTYLGTMSSYAGDAFPLFIMADRPVKSWTDIKPGSGKKIVLGAVGSGSTNLTFPLIAKSALHLNIDIIRGYSGASAIYLAMQSGEVDGQAAGFASILAAQKSLWDAGKFRVLIQFGRTTRLPALADVPTGQELAANDADRALIAFAEAPFFMAMPFIAPPDLPAERAAALQQAFDRACADPAFREEAKKFDLDVSPLRGAEVAKLVRDMAGTPPAVVAQFKAIAESH